MFINWTFKKKVNYIFALKTTSTTLHAQKYYHYTPRSTAIPCYRLTLTNSNFFPSTLRAWNSLDLENRNAPSYISFKRQLVNKTLVPVWYSTGVRKWNIIHTKLRYN
jgi:hypothetical protein